MLLSCYVGWYLVALGHSHFSYSWASSKEALCIQTPKRRSKNDSHFSQCSAVIKQLCGYGFQFTFCFEIFPFHSQRCFCTIVTFLYHSSIISREWNFVRKPFAHKWMNSCIWHANKMCMMTSENRRRWSRVRLRKIFEKNCRFCSCARYIYTFRQPWSHVSGAWYYFEFYLLYINRMRFVLYREIATKIENKNRKIQLAIACLLIRSAYFKSLRLYVYILFVVISFTHSVQPIVCSLLSLRIMKREHIDSAYIYIERGFNFMSRSYHFHTRRTYNDYTYKDVKLRLCRNNNNKS